VNNGNVTISDIKVADDLTGDNWKIDSLKPGKDQTFTTTYTVTSADVVAGSIKNVATVTGTDPDGKDVETTDEETVTTEPVNRGLNVTKTVTNAPANGTAYQIGERIEYVVTVTNNGNVTESNIKVVDQMQGSTGSAELTSGNDGSETGFELAPGESAVLNYAYTVRRGDEGKTLTNSATATGESGTTDTAVTPGESVEPETVPDGTTNPTVTPGGNQAAPVSAATVVRTITRLPQQAANAIGNALEDAAAQVRELVNNDDDEVPLANTNLDNEHKCCVLHFLIMLIAMIVLGFYTRSAKKRQKKIFELREELESEQAKRELPLTNEKQ
jgi:uncharacterized repeat protein (TIGR01451 family)